MHFDMHVCLLEKFCYAALTAKIFANFAPFLDPKMEVEKWTQKWCQNFAKGGPNILLVQKRSPKWVPFLDPILGIKFWHHFWVHFSTSILGSKNGAKFAKVFAVKAA